MLASKISEIFEENFLFLNKKVTKKDIEKKERRKKEKKRN